jgi:hypothetical protein
MFIAVAGCCCGVPCMSRFLDGSPIGLILFLLFFAAWCCPEAGVVFVWHLFAVWNIMLISMQLISSYRSTASVQ